ncbi:hypothetical protein KI387_038334, partial [Taxus chinensis]
MQVSLALFTTSPKHKPSDRSILEFISFLPSDLSFLRSSPLTFPFVIQNYLYWDEILKLL